VKLVSADGRLLDMNPVGLAMIEAPDKASACGANVLDVIAPEYRKEWRQNHARVCKGESLSWEFDIVGMKGTRRRMETHAVPLAMPDGTVAQLAVTRDVTARKRWEEHQRLLINELNHRVKNTLATVQSIASQSLRNAETADEARRTVEERLFALARAHDVLTGENWEGAGLREIVTEAVSPYRHEREDRFRIVGPDARLSPRMALAIAMALQELATNAVKYGALSDEVGQVEIAWSIDGGSVGPRLRLAWRESGGPPVEAPTRRGFGTRLIERSLAQDLHGEVNIDFASTGLVCTLIAPLTADEPESP
jgi:PAS domain S-box-containing protein